MSLKPKHVDFVELWDRLTKTTDDILNGRTVARNVWNDRFSDIYEICVAYPEPLADKLYSSTKDFLEKHVSIICTKLKVCADENLLVEFFTSWKEYNQGAIYINLLYGYLNSQFIRKQKISEADMNYGGFTIDTTEQLLEIGELALEIWKRVLVEQLSSRLVSLLLDQIQRDRLNEPTMDHNVVRGVILSFVEMDRFVAKSPLKFYEEVCESKILEETTSYYSQEATTCIDKYNCHDYMIKVLRYMSDEKMRCNKYLHASSYPKVVQAFQGCLVKDHLEFLHSECQAMVQKELREDLNNLYHLLHPIQNGLTVLVQDVENHVKQTCIDCIRDLQGDNISQTFVESLLAMHTKYSDLVQGVFNSDQLFTTALDKACAAAINYRTTPKSSCRAPELLAKYIDNLLKKGVRGMSEIEIDEKLNSSITIFKYLDDKDIFNRFYAKFLTKRLIYGMSQSMDAEESLINRLKQVCGFEFTSKLHKMFSDMTLNTDLNNKFTAFLKQDGETLVDLGVNFTILVLQAGAWPISSGNVPFAVPQELERSILTFEQFYSKNFTGRKLTWIHAFCQCEVKMNYSRRTYYVTMGNFLVGILLHFNGCEQANVNDLSAATRLPVSELIRQVQQLLDARILMADENPVTKNSTISLNLNYNNRRTKFKIFSMQQKETPQENEQTVSSVEEDRKLYLQAMIVRIMKSRKVLKHNLLIQEVLSQSRGRFAPSVSHIKKSIEILIEKSYIERTKNSDEYSYIA